MTCKISFSRPLLPDCAISSGVIVLWVWFLIIKFVRIFVLGHKESNRENCKQGDKKHAPGPFSIFSGSSGKGIECLSLWKHWLWALYKGREGEGIGT